MAKSENGIQIMKDLLSLYKVYKSYNRNERSAVNNVSFNCSSGQVTAIIGSSGSGKTTLLRIIAGLEIPDSGQVILDGKTINSDSNFIPPEERDCTLVFQDYALFPNMTVLENVSFGKTAKKIKIKSKSFWRWLKSKILRVDILMKSQAGNSNVLHLCEP